MKARWPFLVALPATVYLALSFIFMWSPIVTQQETSGTRPCINNLRIIDAAKEQLAAKGSLPPNTVPTAHDLAPYIKGDITWTNIYFCPQGGKYAFNAIGVNPTCSLGGPTPRRERVGLLHWDWSLSKYHQL